MSDDLANQGRSVGRDLNNGFPVTVERCHIIEQMADRIEELEAEFFEQETKRRDRGLGYGWPVALAFMALTALLIVVIGWMI